MVALPGACFPIPWEDISNAHLPNFDGESYDENLELVRVWDAKGLLKVFSSPSRPGLYSRVFNAYKSTQHDRQIGDRRLPNAMERHLDGPSKHLPPGHLLCQLTVPPFTHAISGSITDRRDFYTTKLRSVLREPDQIRFLSPILENALTDLQPYVLLISPESHRQRRKRNIAGDHLGVADRGFDDQPQLFPAFASLFQGDHLGVEFALASHERLLQDENLLPSPGLGTRCL